MRHTSDLCGSAVWLFVYLKSDVFTPWLFTALFSNLVDHETMHGG